MSKSKHHSGSRGALSAPAQRALRRESVALNAALATGAVTALVFLFYILVWVHLNPVPITGTPSMARPALAVAAFVMLVTFGLVFRANRGPTTGGWFLRLFTTAVLALATAILGTALLAAIVVALAEAFKGITFGPVTAAVMVGAAMGAVVYLTIGHARNTSPQRVYSMLAIIMYGGILLTAITTQDANWYYEYISALGMESAGPTAKIFNVAFIFSGVMLIALGNILLDKVDGFYRHHPQVGPLRLRIIRGLFIVTGVGLAGVGLFPFAENTVQGSLHILSATLAGVFFGAWMIALRWIIPVFKPTFYYFSLAAAGAMGLIYFMGVRGIYFNITGVELASFLISTTWLSLFMTNLVNAAAPEETKH